MGKIFHANCNKKRAGVTILLWDKMDFKSKTIIRDKEGHYIIIKGTIHAAKVVLRGKIAAQYKYLKY